MKIKIMSRYDAIRYCYAPHTESSAIISISTPGIVYSNKPFINNTNEVKHILRLYFTDDDVEPYCMQESEAIEICTFLETYKNVDILIVHCDAGVSRSAAIAAAIMKTQTGDDSSVFDNPLHSPNMHCYRLMLNQLYNSEEQ